MPTKLDYLQQKNLNPADELRELLTSLEILMPSIKNLDSEGALALLNDMDRAYLMLNNLNAQDMDLTSEQARFDTIQARVKKQAHVLLKSLGGPAVLVKHRPSPAPPADTHSWWYIDKEVVARQNRFTRQVFIGVAALAVILLLLYVLYQTVLAPSPEAVARYQAENNALTAIEQGDMEAALAALEKGLAVVPNEPGLLILQGVVLERLNRNQQASAVFEQALAGLNDELSYHIGRAQTYLRIAEYEKAEADALAAIKLDEQSPAAWLMLGQALESLDRTQEAIQAYETAGKLAQEQGNNEIVVISRLAVGRMIGGPGSIQ